MDKLKPVIIIACLANLITFLLYKYAANQPGGSGATLAFTVLWMPLLWIPSVIIVLILAIRGRRVLFKSAILRWSVVALICCTPLPMLILFEVSTYTPIYCAETGYYPHNGYTIKDEEWEYRTNLKLVVKKFFKLNTENYEGEDDSLFKKDSDWVYFNSNGDTTKIERYSNGKLLSIILKNKSK